MNPCRPAIRSRARAGATQVVALAAALAGSGCITVAAKGGVMHLPEVGLEADVGGEVDGVYFAFDPLHDHDGPAPLVGANLSLTGGPRHLWFLIGVEGGVVILPEDKPLAIPMLLLRPELGVLAVDPADDASLDAGFEGGVTLEQRTFIGRFVLGFEGHVGGRASELSGVVGSGRLTLGVLVSP